MFKNEYGCFAWNAFIRISGAITLKSFQLLFTKHCIDKKHFRYWTEYENKMLECFECINLGLLIFNVFKIIGVDIYHAVKVLYISFFNRIYSMDHSERETLLYLFLSLSFAFEHFNCQLLISKVKIPENLWLITSQLNVHLYIQSNNGFISLLWFYTSWNGA